MTLGLRHGLAAAAAAGMLVIGLGGLVTDGGEEFVWLVFIALAPAAFGAFSSVPIAREHGPPSERLRRIAAPRLAWSLGLSFFLLGIVVGGSLWGLPGGLVGAGLGFLVGAEFIWSMRYIRRVADSIEEAEAPAPRVPGGRVFAWALTSVGLVISSLLVAAFGYLLFGAPGAVVLAAFSILSFATLAITSVIRRRREASE